ncbi:MAG: hypothetical protein IPH08_11055 [Rhodocyclaceae bacterium]|nr:hypothetical protein [Rhodocyclaceae bacterium]
MKFLNPLLLVVVLLTSFHSNAESPQKENPMKGVKRWGSIPVVKDTIYFPIPDGFPMTAAWDQNKPGLYQAWFYPDGQTKENWKDTLHLMAFPVSQGAAIPPCKQLLEIISQPIKAACPHDFLSEPKLQQDAKRASAIMGCRKLP